jgi:hypothetical protein
VAHYSGHESVPLLQPPADDTQRAQVDDRLNRVCASVFETMSQNPAVAGGAVLHAPKPNYGPGSSRPNQMGANSAMSDSTARVILQEAVDAVMNSFAKHTQGYGRGRTLEIFTLAHFGTVF